MGRIKISQRFSKKVQCPVCLWTEMFSNKYELNHFLKSHYRNCNVPYDIAFEIKEYVVLKEVV